ncbi:MAG: YdcF family protein [Flavobacteriales bacterium]|jgi:uncharacterized SAM-binding protein YcdF (DUF218 family)|nr:YdcF family protein [Flavobacteriales bacterium]
MTRKKNRYRRIAGYLIVALACYFVYNGITIYEYSGIYIEDQSEVAIVLGAGTSEGVLSPVFAERTNHAKYLFDQGLVKKILITGGYGEGQIQSDSEIGKQYLLSEGVPIEALIIEEKSRYTIENLIEAKSVMDSLGFTSALLVSDPLHMKRAMKLAEKQNIDCLPSPTKTTMYRSFLPQAKSLFYETFYYTLGQIAGKN